MWSELASPFYCLLILPCPDKFRVSAEQYIRNFPSVEFGRSGIDRRRDKPVLETVAQCRGLVAYGSWDQPYYRVCQDRCRKLTSAQNVDDVKAAAAAGREAMQADPNVTPAARQKFEAAFAKPEEVLQRVQRMRSAQPAAPKK